MLAALIIAAGKTTRRNSFEPQKEVGSISAIQRIIMLFQRAGIDRIVVVCDEDESKAEKLASPMNVVYLHSGGDAEMFDNVKIGLAYLRNKCTAVMITHSDVPLFSVETLRTLIAAEGPVCIPSHNGVAGHPLLLSAEQFQAVLAYAGEGGLAGAVHSLGEKRRFIEVEDEGVLTNVNYEKNYAHLITKNSLRESYSDFRIHIVKEKPFYGPGAHLLLQLTEETRSLRNACRQMGISYSKGRAIISLMEQQAGYPIMETQQGGKTGGYSIVTEKGKKLMHQYAEFYAEAKPYLQKLFDKHFAE